MQITKLNSIYFDINNKGPGVGNDRYRITQIGAVHAKTKQCFNKKIKFIYETPDVLESFLKWIKKVTGGRPAVLIGHNAFSFDANILKGAAEIHGVELPTRRVAGYADSLHAFRCNSFNKNNDLTSLAKVFGMPRKTHDALEDSKLLKNIVTSALKKTGKNLNQFFKGAFDPNE
jgi:DNA polymerase III epsilon subunit-like protein